MIFLSLYYDQFPFTLLWSISFHTTIIHFLSLSYDISFHTTMIFLSPYYDQFPFTLLWTISFHSTMNNFLSHYSDIPFTLLWYSSHTTIINFLSHYYDIPFTTHELRGDVVARDYIEVIGNNPYRTTSIKTLLNNSQSETCHLNSAI
jgi:hypothetical protein